MGVRKINTVVTSKDAIITACRELAAREGLQAINMRTVAGKCNVAVGSVYNYFPSKADLIAATIQDIWRAIFHMNPSSSPPDSFVGHVEWIFTSVKAGAAEYPNFFTAHSISFAGGDKGKGRSVMESYFAHMKMGLLEVLSADSMVKLEVFSDSLTQVEFVDFVFSSLLTMLVKQQSSCRVLCEVIRRTIY